MELTKIDDHTFKIDEKHHLRKVKDEYRIIYPIKDSKNNMNWKNFLIGGRWSNLFIIIFILILLFYLSWGYKQDISAWEEYVEKNCHKIRSYEAPNISSLQVVVNEHGVSIPSSGNDEILS
jgi:hypothetical protein